MNTEARAQNIKSTLDNELELTYLKNNFGEGIDRGAIETFQKIFVETLNFDRISDPFGGIGESVSIEGWNKRSNAQKAYIIAESGEYRVVYIRLGKLTRTAQRFAISSLTSQGWAQKGEFIAIFYAEDSDVWHLVSPYIEKGKDLSEGRTVLRRYVIGKGETHRTVSNNLAIMDASLPAPLFGRIEEAFQLKPITKDFYKNYKEIFNLLKEKITAQSIEIGDAKTYAHLLLNRLMFLYFIQKKGWLNENKDFVHWYLQKYEKTKEQGKFHTKWLQTLFFDAMNNPPQNKDISSNFPKEISKALNNIPFLNGGLFEKQETDQLEPELSDSLIRQVIIGFLENYNFTVTEESPFDVDVAVDPAMLGKIYESLIAEQERGKAGIFYTPRVEVDLMCRLALYEYLIEDRTEELEENANTNQIEELTDEDNREELIKFLFTPLEQWDFDRASKFKPLKSLLKKSKIVDPACGSGAFLVGMMQVLAELQRKMGIEPGYHLKEMIVNNNLHGVDIKDWAVRMAEFRLWLSLIEGEEELPQEEPLLPNFSFKLNVGDSIIQKIGDEQISFQSIRNPKYLHQRTDRLQELEELMNKYFSGQEKLLEKIRDKQQELLNEYIDSTIDKLKQRKSDHGQLNLEGEIPDEEKEKVRKLNKKISKLSEKKRDLGKAREEGLFLWELDYPEVMLKGGFDIVIANPPYVRQEDIMPQDIGPEKLDEFSNDHIEELKEKYQEDLMDYVKQIHRKKVDGKSDLYVYFFLKGLEILKGGGSLVFITSNSWLDVGYGGPLQEHLLQKGLNYILNNRSKRVFEESDVNTVISIVNTDDKGEEIDFVSFKESYKKINNSEKVWNMVNPSKNIFDSIKMPSQKTDKSLEIHFTSQKEYKHIKTSLETLWQLGGGKISKSQKNLKNKGKLKKDTYSVDKWGAKYLRTPDFLFPLIDEKKLLPMGSLCNLSYGSKLGITGFFRLNQKNREKWNLDERFLTKIVSSTKEMKGFSIKPENVQKSVFDCQLTKNQLKKKGYENTHDYIEWGEDQVTEKKGRHTVENVPWPEVSSVKSNSPEWHCINLKEPGDFIVPLLIRERFFFASNPKKLYASNMFYQGKFKKEEFSSLGPAILNSTLTYLMMEIYGRHNVPGRFNLYGPDLKPLPVPNPALFSNDKREKISQAFKEMSKRRPEKVFKELGINQEELEKVNPSNLRLDKIKKDRRLLDKLVFEELGIDEDKQLSLYRYFLNLVKQRLLKEKSK